MAAKPSTMSADALSQGQERAALLAGAREDRVAVAELPARAARLVPGPGGGTIGEIQGLNSGQPRMVLAQPDGKLTLHGVLVRPAHGVLWLSCDGTKHAVSCQDSFSAMIAFVKATWKPAAASGSDAAAVTDRSAPSGATRRRGPFVPAGCSSHGHIGCGRPAEAEEARAAGYDEAMTAKWFSARALADQQPIVGTGAAAGQEAASLESSQSSRSGRPLSGKRSRAAHASSELVELFGPLAAQGPPQSPTRAAPPRVAGKRSRVALGSWSAGKAAAPGPADSLSDSDGSTGEGAVKMASRSGRGRAARQTRAASSEDDSEADVAGSSVSGEGSGSSSEGERSPPPRRASRSSARRPRREEAAEGDESAEEDESESESELEEVDAAAESDFDPDD